MIKRHGWLKPTEGARQASSMRVSSVPLGNGSRRKCRTSRRQVKRSRKRARNAPSKLIDRRAPAAASSIFDFARGLTDENLAIVAERSHRHFEAPPIWRARRQAEAQPHWML